VRVLLRPEERRPDPAPLPADDRRPVLVGTVLWLVALLACLLFADELAAQDRSWWTWACVAGAALGVIGLVHLQRRRARGLTD